MLIQGGRVMHICASKLSNYWFRWWLVACSATSHYLNPCWYIVNGTLRNILKWNIYTFSLKKMHLKMSSVKWWPFGLSLIVLTLWFPFPGCSWSFSRCPSGGGDCSRWSLLVPLKLWLQHSTQGRVMDQGLKYLIARWLRASKAAIGASGFWQNFLLNVGSQVNKNFGYFEPCGLDITYPTVRRPRTSKTASWARGFLENFISNHIESVLKN